MTQWSTIISRQIFTCLITPIAIISLAGCGITTGNAKQIAAKSIKVSPSSANITLGTVMQFRAEDNDGSLISDCQWNSSNPTVLGIDKSGEATALAAGNTAIAASCDGQTAQASVEVTSTGNPSESNNSITSFHWIAPTVGSNNSLGILSGLSVGGNMIPLVQPIIMSSKGILRCTNTKWANGQQLTITYLVGDSTVHVTLGIFAQAKGVAVTFTADSALISSIDIGDWSASTEAKAVTTPYYTGSVFYLTGIGEFGNAWWDWRTTNATSLDGTIAQYQPRTDGTLSTMQEQLMIMVSPNVDDVFPKIENPASPYMKELAGKMLIDISTAGFAKIQAGFDQLKDYGITDCAAIIHNWQHAGYDNALPEHLSANDSLGGNSGLEAAIAAGKSDGCLMAVHENYVDYYPNYPEFDPSALSLTSNGDRLPTWLNHFGVQAYSTKPSWILRNAATQSPQIHSLLGTTATYIDVNSAAPISSRGDMDSRQPGAGQLRTWMDASANLWTYERQVHGGPVFGEGWSHWYYSGLLDGVEAQLGAGVAGNTGEDLPLFVDFDLLRIHPLQVNQGMGIYARWVKSTSQISTTAQMDAYRMQEIAFGHAPFLDTSFWTDILHGFVDSNLISTVAAAYGTAHANSIQYGVNGNWITPSEAARSNQFETVQVGYDNGINVVANAAPESMEWNGITIPQYGWAAKGNGLLAYTALCGTIICDYAETPELLFANARNQLDTLAATAFAQPTISKITVDSNHYLSIIYRWMVYSSTAQSYKAFVHFVDDNQLAENEGIIFTGDHLPIIPTSKWEPNNTITDGPWSVQIPPTVPDGTYSIRMGLFDPQTGDRVQLAGDVDDQNRYIVGYITLMNGGSTISFSPTPSTTDDPRLNGQGSILDFGTVQTDGMISIHQENGQWVLRPFPRSRAFTVLLNSDRFQMPSFVTAVRNDSTNSTFSVLPIINGQYWQIPMIGAKSYSWPASN